MAPMVPLCWMETCAKSFVQAEQPELEELEQPGGTAKRNNRDVQLTPRSVMYRVHCNAKLGRSSNFTFPSKKLEGNK